MDVSNKAEFKKALEQILNTFSEVDILINGAGINGATPFLEIDINEWDSIMDSQIKGTFHGCQVLENICSKGKGQLLISSASAGPPLSKAFTYSVAKAELKI